LRTSNMSVMISMAIWPRWLPTPRPRNGGTL